MLGIKLSGLKFSLSMPLGDDNDDDDDDEDGGRDPKRRGFTLEWSTGQPPPGVEGTDVDFV